VVLTGGTLTSRLDLMRVVASTAAFFGGWLERAVGVGFGLGALLGPEETDRLLSSCMGRWWWGCGLGDRELPHSSSEGGGGFVTDRTGSHRTASIGVSLVGVLVGVGGGHGSGPPVA
jgi:hypothetical protein